ncbi:MAG: hypothetical protein ACJAS4_000856 [Bacteriovoracaceae bacterium]|jgi:hypothetical protein
MLKKSICFFLIAVSFESLGTVDLQVYNKDNRKNMTFCRAEGIGDGLFFTAAHCVLGIKKEEIIIENTEISNIKTHGFYNKNFIYNQLDFAIIETTKKDSKVHFKEARKGMVVTILSHKAIITEIFETEFKINFFDTSVCLNDSGSGAYSDGKLIGILSRGSRKCESFAYITKASIIETFKEDFHGLEPLALKYKKDFIVKMIKFNLGK